MMSKEQVVMKKKRRTLSTISRHSHLVILDWNGWKLRIPRAAKSCGKKTSGTVQHQKSKMSNSQRRSSSARCSAVSSASTPSMRSKILKSYSGWNSMVTSWKRWRFLLGSWSLAPLTHGIRWSKLTWVMSCQLNNFQVTYWLRPTSCRVTRSLRNRRTKYSTFDRIFFKPA